MRIPEWRDLRKPAPLLAVLAAALLGVALAFRGWDAYVEDCLGRWAVDKLARQSDSTYRLALGDLSLLPLAGSISFDSAGVVTDSARNARRPEPLPGLTAGVRDCRLSGLDLVGLALRKGVQCPGAGVRSRGRGHRAPASHSGGLGGCDRHDGRRGLGAPADPAARHLLLPRRGDLVPSLSLTLERPGPRGGASVALEHARFEAGDFVFDPSTASVDRALLSATGLVLRPDTLIEFSAARLQADFTDSTLVSRASSTSRPYPRPSGCAARRAARPDPLHGGQPLRAGRGLSRLPHRRRHRYPRPGASRRTAGRADRQAHPKGLRAASAPAGGGADRLGARLDTVVVGGGTITYRERKPETDGPGVVTFEQVRGTILDLHLPSRGEPLRIKASARLMGEGALTGASRFRWTRPTFATSCPAGSAGCRQGLQPVPVGERGVRARWRVGGGDRHPADDEGRRSRTTVTPRYRELSVDPTGEGGGVIGSVTRGAKEFLAQTFVVRSSNPDGADEPPRVARTARPYDPTKPWLQFLWISLREGLMEVIKE